MMLEAAVIEELRTLLGADHVTVGEDELRWVAENTLGLERRLLAVVRPATVDEMRAIVELANRHRLVLYPVSRGLNVGYGDRAPVRDNQVLVDLRRMDRIRDFDALHGRVVVEPGVTQQQLYDFLVEQDADFWMDVTGSSSEASVLGNTIDGGFGHTPVGYRRRLLEGVEVVLGNGSVLHCGSFPAIGPDLNGLFVQSNLGIVTAIKVPLFPKPDRCRSFLLSIREDDRLEEMIERLVKLRRDGVLTSLVHTVNAVRSLVTFRPYPQEFESRIITLADAVNLTSTPIVRTGSWTAIGGLYGSKRMVSARAAEIRKAFRGLARAQMISDRKVQTLKKIVQSWPVRDAAWAEMIRAGVEASEVVHGFSRGVPSDAGFESTLWRVDRFQDLGFIWLNGTVEATGERVRDVLEIAGRLFRRIGFELPVTLSSVTPETIVATMSCSFHRKDPAQIERAHELFFKVSEEFARAGIKPARGSLLGMDRTRYDDEGKPEALEELKKSFDPNGVIAPGRYGVG
jgi:4-cresol dehydrogenase (hydroxylating)